MKRGVILLDIKDGRQYRSFDMRPEGGKIEGYAVVFNNKTLMGKDPYTGMDYYEIIDRSALDDCDMSDVVLTVDHEGIPIARTRAGNLLLTVDDYGLKVMADLTTSRGKDILEEVQVGNLDKMSFAFNVEDESFDREQHTRTIGKISKLWDVSVVTRPAYEQTCVFARASMAAHMEAEQRAYVAEKLAALRGAIIPEAPQMRKGPEWGGLEDDLAKYQKLEQRAHEVQSWEPEGVPEDVNAVNTHRDTLEGILQELEALGKDTRAKIEAVEKCQVQCYGWHPLQIRPTDRKNENRSILEMNDNNIEIRALQSYLCKGITQMEEDEKRALTTTGSGGAVIPVEIANKVITNAGYSILTHRASRFADGRRGKLVIPVARASGGVGWHEEMAEVDIFDESLSSIAVEGMELVKIISASKSMTAMAVDEFASYLTNLLSGELLDTLEQAYITGEKGVSGPANGLDHVDLTARTIQATGGIAIENIAAAIATLPAKVQHKALVMGNATTLAGILTSQGNYVFDVRDTLKDMGIELVQNPYVQNETLYVVGDPQQALFLNFWQPIAVESNDAALFTRVATAIRALTIVGFVWVPDYISKITVSASK